MDWASDSSPMTDVSLKQQAGWYLHGSFIVLFWINSFYSYKSPTDFSITLALTKTDITVIGKSWFITRSR